MAQENADKHIDADILECKQDILRAQQAILKANLKKQQGDAVHRPDELQKMAGVSKEVMHKVPEDVKRTPEASPVEPHEDKIVAGRPDDRDEDQDFDSAESTSIDEIKILEGIKSLSSGGDTNTGDIPRFDLAEQILAEQRKVSSIKRKGPGKYPDIVEKFVPVQGYPNSISQVKEGKQRSLSTHHQIIAKIVARDIERVRKGSVRNPA